MKRKVNSRVDIAPSKASLNQLIELFSELTDVTHHLDGLLGNDLC